MTKEIVKLEEIKGSDYGIEEIKAKQIKAVFVPMLNRMEELEEEYNKIIKLDIDENTCKKAKELRLKYVKLRTTTAKLHKEQKAFYLAGGRFVDGLKNAQAFASQGIEEKLSDIEKYYENIELEKKKKIGLEREEILRSHDVEFIPTNLADMDDAIWDTYLTGVIAAESARKEAEEKARLEAEEERKKQEEAAKKAEEERIAKEKALAEENERLKKEAELAAKKAKEADEKRKKEDAAKKRKEEAERKAREEKEAKQKAEAEKKLAEEKAKKDAAIKKAEKAAKKLEEEKKKLEAEKKAIEDAERKRQEDIKKAEAKAKAEYEAKQKAALMAPDKEKLQSLILDIQNIKIPQLATSEAVQITDGVNTLLGKVVKYIEDKSNQI